MIVIFVGKVTHLGMLHCLCMTISCLYRVYVTYLSLMVSVSFTTCQSTFRLSPTATGKRWEHPSMSNPSQSRQSQLQCPACSSAPKHWL